MNENLFPLGKVKICKHVWLECFKSSVFNVVLNISISLYELHKMAVTVRATLLFHLLLISQVYCCYWSAKNLRQVCDSLISVSVEGNDTWNNLFLTSHKPFPFALRAHSFKKTPNLRVLSVLNVNQIEQDSLAGLKKLDKIIVTNSSIDEVPKEVFANLPIRDMQLFNAAIKNFVPGFFENLPDIRIVDFRKNIMTEVKAGVFNSTPIYKLYLGGNLIESIEDDAFIDMKNLHYLSLARNRLTTFESLRVLGTSDSLQSLWLDKNNLTKITTKVLESVPYLEKVYFEINQIDDVEDAAFEKVPQIDCIDLSNNLLTELRPRVFALSGAKQLYYFFLHNNRLTFISRALFIRTPKLKYITFGGNPFQCPCLDHIQRWTVNMTRLCDDVYYSGDRPSCVHSEESKIECLYDTDLTRDLYDIYIEAIAEYPTLDLKCDTAKGVENAKLANFSYSYTSLHI